MWNSGICFMRCGPQPIELPLEDTVRSRLVDINIPKNEIVIPQFGYVTAIKNNYSHE
jgi:hypothetical protein